MSVPVLETENLVKVYGRGAARFDALKGLTFEIHDGESVAVVGKSGSGKSTLMHLLALLDRPTAGVVALGGEPVSELKPRRVSQLRNASFGFVFQQFFLNANQSVLENVTLPLKITGMSRGERNRRGMEVLEQLEIADKAKNKAKDLSGGQKQRVCIARALVNRPSVIFADEPTGNLDSTTSEIVEDILFNLHRDHGITLVVVTHDEDLAARCERRLKMQDGEIVAEEHGVLADRHVDTTYDPDQLGVDPDEPRGRSRSAAAQAAEDVAARDEAADEEHDEDGSPLRRGRRRASRARDRARDTFRDRVRGRSRAEETSAEDSDEPEGSETTDATDAADAAETGGAAEDDQPAGETSQTRRRGRDADEEGTA
ncbi:ABC transporter ATP-binding protein [Nesterenkonia sp. F]|uniref:ABC transporter ATP-binding protein n=1 Tax=Nesterenkonia sp. F TaxID=795955 RepID=UPI000255D998|nr:ABC transporter ATP-binding protein [Nesterenkonia sp. F]